MAENCIRFAAIDISALLTYKDSAVTWTQNLPTGTSIVVETAIDGETFTAISSGDEIADLNASDDLTGIFVTIKVTLATSNAAFTPVFSALAVNVEGEGDALSSDTDDHYKYGAITWTSGANDGLVMEVKGWTDSTRELELFLPMPYAMAVGDRFSIYPGCDKTKEVCFTTFDNIDNMRAEPHVPGEDGTLRYPDAI